MSSRRVSVTDSMFALARIQRASWRSAPVTALTLRGARTLRAQPGTFFRRQTAGEVGHRRPGRKDRVERCEDASLAQRADDPSDLARRHEFLGGFDDEHAAVEGVRIEWESPGGEETFDELDAPRCGGH
jgi:hypothetical protein